MEKANISWAKLGSATYAAKRAADIVAVLQNENGHSRQELIGDLNETLKAYNERRKITPADLADLKVVSQRLHAVFASKNTKAAAALLNELLRDYASMPRLSSHGGTVWHMHVDKSDHAPWHEWFAASSALALATLLAEKQRNPGGLCVSPSCGRPYIDLGKGGRRSYCSPRCATRERVAAFRKGRKMSEPGI